MGRPLLLLNVGYPLLMMLKTRGWVIEIQLQPHQGPGNLGRRPCGGVPRPTMSLDIANGRSDCPDLRSVAVC